MSKNVFNKRHLLIEPKTPLQDERYTVIKGTWANHEVLGAFYEKDHAQLFLVAPELLEALKISLAVLKTNRLTRGGGFKALG